MSRPGGRDVLSSTCCWGMACPTVLQSYRTTVPNHYFTLRGVVVWYLRYGIPLVNDVSNVVARDASIAELSHQGIPSGDRYDRIFVKPLRSAGGLSVPARGTSADE
ncbi:hypothetical protein BZA05DRAFT_417132 [Tricharina praecox]|uniref:uncharacterized protein n=1 Tax=Tricharina praecox TaxID=43433 RepID=UPI002220F000|nr:uncharacterized protein BZA05DRAFT_417132 [Tricharina praecox]KAI5854589.1 hypothetical protein BZA05DRAFT_417132 [Tricharina praecox]